MYDLLRNPISLSLLCLLLGSVAHSSTDWLLNPSAFKAVVSINAQTVTLDNGLARRVIQLTPNAATISLKLVTDGTEYVRSVRPEASVELDGKRYDIGGLAGQPVQNYLDPTWLKTMTAAPGAYAFDRAEAGPTKECFPWKKRLEWMPADMPWPPPGKSATLHFRGSSGELPAIQVHYEIYDGLPLISKWITVHNDTSKSVRLNTFICEILAAVEPESIVDDSPSWRLPNLFVETDYTFGGMSGPNHSAGVHWVVDPLYPTQVNYNRNTPYLLECKPPIGPDQIIAPGAMFESFRAFELLQDSTDRERQSLALRRMYRAIAPWSTENSILMHVRSAAPDAVKLAIDQCAAVGFQMVILTFGSGFDFESRDPKYQQQIKELADYGRSKGVALGGYSLLASRGAGISADNTQGSPARFDVMPCLGAQ